MITDSDIDELIQPIINIYNQMEMDLIVEIAKRFDTYDKIGGSLEWQLKKLSEVSDLNSAVIKLIAKYSKKSEKEILKMLNAAGFSNLDMQLLNDAYSDGLISVDPVKMLDSPSIAATIELSYKELKDTYRLIQTKAIESSRQAYMSILNSSYLDVASGFYDYQTSIKRAVGQMAAKGIEGATYKRGNKLVRYSIEGTVRRDTLTAVHQLSNKITMQSCDEMHCDYVEISQHIGARVHPTNPIANHAGWQGKVFKISGKTQKYPNLKESTGYPDDILGLGGVNCRHRMFPFIPGFSAPNPIKYSSEENERIYNLTQKQRKLERDIRILKKQQAAAQAMGDEETATLMKNKLNVKFDEINKFCKQNGLIRDYSRELVSEQINKKSVKNFNSSDIIESIGGKKIQTVNYIGKLDRNIYKCVTDDIVTDDVIITEKQIEHIKANHPNDYEQFGSYFKEIVANPDYIIEANKPNSALVLKNIKIKEEQFKTVVRLATSKDNPNFKNSVITFMKIDQKEWNRIIRNKKILYKSE